MEKTGSKKAIKITAIVLSILLVLGVATGLIIYFVTQIKPNWKLAAKLNTRAENAQYLPEASKLVGNSEAAQTISTMSNKSENYFNDNSMSLDEYNQLIEDIGAIWHPYQGDFVIQDVRDIVVYMSENVGVFDRWFRYRGTNRSGTEEDFSNIPKGLADGEFYMSYDEKNESFQLIQCMGFQPWAYDSDTQKAFWNYGETSDDTTPTKNGPGDVPSSYRSNWPVMEENVLIINYYYIGEGENKKEVVDVDIVEFLHVYNKTIINGYQKLSNIKDTCFTKYEISFTKFVTAPSGYSGIDYKNVVDTGVVTEFLQIDYTDSQNISILKINNKLGSESTIEFEGIINGSKNNFLSRYSLSEDKIVSNVSRTGNNIENVTNSFNSLIKSLTSSSRFSLVTDLTNTAEVDYEQSIKNYLDSAVDIIVKDSYLLNNYEKGLKIWWRNAVDITDKIHKPNN